MILMICDVYLIFSNHLTLYPGVHGMITVKEGKPERHGRKPSAGTCDHRELHVELRGRD